MPDNSEVTSFTKKLKSVGSASKSKADDLCIKIFADGADKETILRYYKEPFIAGFTTNPTLMRKAGVTDYEQFAQDILRIIRDRPISFEVFSDDFDEMERQANVIASWGENVYIKIPITNTAGHSSVSLIKRLAKAKIKINVTAITLYEQVSETVAALANSNSSIVSVFAGRIADSGQDPVPIMKKCLELLYDYPKIELLWASPRELYNLVQADSIGCHIITITDDILKKLPLLGKDLKAVSLDTVRMFYNDAHTAGYTIQIEKSLSINSAE